ncbi:hypothetical protein STP4a_123 [Salmonella phage STP4-a]|uniref:Uncharacterized protein n=1 Tax=Salmonella phage STP4-a TaxID=1445860 RepID=A0A0B4L9D6_9CAUD|nr:hypothetical protein STP4a_123 [Salmonella phage STP4-a]AHJ86977.1 hypothetical protein STP4a_123 [Salmonella phage STP4-a]UFK27248.1 hypothetical protein LG358_00227 [Escherichia phage UoN_LG358_1]WKV23475.1 hypothetical protein SEA1_gp0127 [Salmonella phage SEA1]
MTKFLKYASWIFLVPLDFISMVLAVVLTPFIVPFYSEKTGHLPKGFRWMETYDNPIDGDRGHIERWSKIRKIPVLGKYFQRVAWLWRNKAYNFAYYVLGRPATSEFHYRGNPNVESGSPDKAHHGWLFMWNDDAWGVFAAVPYLRIGKIQFYLRVYCGWKLKSLLSRPIPRAMLAFHINPFRFYKI